MQRATVTALTAAACLSTALPAAVAAAPEYILPQRWNDDFRPGSYCSTPGENGIYATATRRWFDQTDAASVANRNEEPVPVKQKVKESRTSTYTVSATITPQGEITKYLASAYGMNYVRIDHWSVGQTVGPYQLGPGKQGTLVWGFMMLDADAQNVRCSVDQVWEAVGAPYTATVTESRYSELRENQAPVWG